MRKGLMVLSLLLLDASCVLEMDLISSYSSTQYT